MTLTFCSIFYRGLAMSSFMAKELYLWLAVNSSSCVALAPSSDSKVASLTITISDLIVLNYKPDGFNT